MSTKEVKAEVEAEGYRLVECTATLPRQSSFCLPQAVPS